MWRGMKMGKSCSGCSGSNCSGCSGCGRELVLSGAEMDFLRLLGQVAFLPVARKRDDPTPAYLEDDRMTGEEYSLLLQILEKKNLISLDYDKPLKGFREDAYAAYPIRGSMALTARGQQVLEWLDYQGVTEE